MARTALFALVERSMRMARASMHGGVPVDEIVEIRRERMVTRRQFLAASAAAVAGASFQRCATAPAPLRAVASDDPVLIVGGGIAGLTAAWRLQQAGVSSRIVEAQNRIGGRMYSIRGFFPEGQVAELGGELIDSNHEAIRRLATELGVELNDLELDDPKLSREVFYFDGAIRSEADVVEAFRPIAALIERDLATISGDDVTYDATNGGEVLDRMSIAQWFDRAGVSGWVRRLLDVAYTTEYGLEIDEQSSLNFLMMIDTNVDPFRIFGESDERYHVRGGNDLIVQRLVERLAMPVDTNTMLEALSTRGDGAYVATVRSNGVSRNIAAQHVIMTIPFTMLRNVDLRVEMPEVKRRAINELGYGTNAKLMTGFSNRVWRANGSNGSTLTDLPFQLCWETSRLQPGQSGILTNFTGGRHGVEVGQGTDAEQAAAFVAQLDKLHPGAAAAHAGMKHVRFHWPTHPMTRGSYASHRVGQWTTIRGAERETVGRIYFAGEHCSLESQGFMNGGCETGEAAAMALLASLGKAAVAA